MAGFFSRPMTSGADDYPVGMDELGNVIYSTPMGDTYTVKMQPAPRESVLKGAWNAMREDPLGFGGNVLRGMAEGVWQGVSAPGRAAAGEPVTYGDVAATAMDWALPQVPGLGAKYDPTQVNMGIRAYHGSPHDFDKFSLDHIGTGEGAQAYGHGLYFAEAEDVADSYKNSVMRNSDELLNIARRAGLEGDAAEMLAFQFSQNNFHGKGFDAWLDGLKADEARGWSSPRSRDAINQIINAEVEASDAVSKMRSPGHMYEVNINADPNDFLDWDAPLSEQPQALRDVVNNADLSHLPTGGRLRRTIEAYRQNPGDWMPEAGANIPEPTGNQIHSALTDYGTSTPDNANLTATLRQAGIPGIKYKDGMSRGADGGTRNYVVFDDSLIDIVRKYGWAGLAPLGINALSQEQQY